MTHLDQLHLPAIAARVPVPDYDRAEVRTGIVHIGVGGFHRSHLAMYVDRLLAGTDHARLDWGITGVGLLPSDARLAEALQAQDCLYTLVLKHPDGALEPRVIGSIIRYLHAPADPGAVLDVMSAASTRIVSLTITEGGYHVDQVTGEFDAGDAGIQADLRGDGPPVTAFGFLAEALARRRAAGAPPFTVMSCDNIPGNGHVTRRMLTSFVQRTDPDLAHWIDGNVRFPNAMVDRITPVTTDTDRLRVQEALDVEDAWPVVAEPFTQWVLEDQFGNGRPDFAAVGAQLVADVEPYEQMKLRLLNASHQALCYLGYLAGYRYAHEVCQDPLFATFLLAYMDQEATPTLAVTPGVDLTVYKRQLIERFANPEIRDTLARLCAESSDRIPKWLVPVVKDQLEAGRPVHHAALVIAAWARYAEGIDEQGEKIDVVDHRKEEVMARAQGQDADPLAFLRDPSLFGDLVSSEAFTVEYLAALESLKSQGARRTLQTWLASVGVPE